jgi:hypothetical protein
MVLLLLLVGGLVALVGYVWILISAFLESVPWGVGIFFLSPLAFVYGFLHWEEAKVPTVLMGAGVLAHVLGRVLS